MVLRDESATKRVGAQIQLSVEKAKELLSASGLDLDTLRAAALKPGFTGVALRANASFHLQNTLRQVDSGDVDREARRQRPRLKNEYVSTHRPLDHLGTDGNKICRSHDHIRRNGRCLEIAEHTRSFARAEAQHPVHVPDCGRKRPPRDQVLRAAPALPAQGHPRQYQSGYLQ
jgi:hypothetical protein